MTSSYWSGDCNGASLLVMAANIILVKKLQTATYWVALKITIVKVLLFKPRQEI